MIICVARGWMSTIDPKKLQCPHLDVGTRGELSVGHRYVFNSALQNTITRVKPCGEKIVHIDLFLINCTASQQSQEY